MGRLLLNVLSYRSISEATDGSASDFTGGAPAHIAIVVVQGAAHGVVDAARCRTPEES